ncbi:hypothetical protein [Companilactobacillus mishanensis]|uniref:DUF806 family protein n=1 Tax=Companilactobacillus mishanensis TaxID=2486008 RepID=A0A5P0ZGJ8_9LACO|nr:hypothetical protein [Companilactobacillus mishanensis]MQS52171.1 hypothetical protein [Companilactobacillus mishanensis]
MTVNEYDIHTFLDSNSVLKTMMDKLRGKKLPVNPVFVGTPVNSFIENKNAPWIRITTIPGDIADYADDERVVEYPRFQIDFWVDKTKAKPSIEMEELIYKIMRSYGFERYYKNRNTDSDMPALLMIQNNFEFMGLTQ